MPASPADSLYFALKEAGVAVQRVGDCVAPRRAHAAVIDGERVGSAIGSRLAGRPPMLRRSMRRR
ncbi:MAG: hypothetical protein R2698_07075 [Microthrixaceae bacterium]